MNSFKRLLPILFFIAGLCGCGKGADIRSYTVEYGESAVYSQQDMDAAVEKIVQEFREWDGCVLYSLSYAGDGCSERELNSCREREKNRDFDECIVFDASFRSPLEGGEAWEADFVYQWSWILARSSGGTWTLVDWGVL